MLAPSNQSTLVKVPARHLLRGDLTGSGEVVLSVSVGTKTPRGMVDVLLQKGERKRAAIWNARTIIGVRRGGTPPVKSRSPRWKFPFRIACRHFTSSPASTPARRGTGSHPSSSAKSVCSLSGLARSANARGTLTKPSRPSAKGSARAIGRPRFRQRPFGRAFKSNWSKAPHAPHLKRSANTSTPFGPSSLAGKPERR